MELIWKYKIDLVDIDIFNTIEEKYKIVFDDELRKFIIEHNGSTPSKYNFMLLNSERVFGAVLSFNEEDIDEEIDTVFPVLDFISTKNIIPFAIDPFGNYICFNIKSGEVVFWNHEEDSVISTNKSLNSFIESLY